MDNNSENISQETGFEPNYSYPPKPELQEKKGNFISQSLISLASYFLIFYLLFGQDISYIAAILVVIIIHEFGHLLLMKFFKYKDVKIFILPLIGALTSGEKENVSQKQLSLIILGGPIPGILIGLAIYYFNISEQNETLKMLANSFLILNIFNLLPIYPLDGGRLLETLFFKHNYVIRLVFSIISVIVLVFLFLIANQLFLLVVPAFMILELVNESKNEKIRTYLLTEKIDYKTEYESLTNKAYWIIRDCIILAFNRKFQAVEAGKYQYSVYEPILINHVRKVLMPKIHFDMSVILKIAIVLIYIAAIIAPLYVVFRLL